MDKMKELYLTPKIKSDIQLNGVQKFNDNNWKSNGITEAQKEFDDRYNEIKKEYDKLQEDFYWNNLIYESKFKFEPRVGYIYHLYKDGGNNILSLISPREWKMDYIGSFKLKYNMIWERIK